MSVSAVRVIDHPTAPVELWRDDSIPDAPVVGIEVGFAGKVGDDPQYIPVEVARQVAAAILATIPE